MDQLNPSEISELIKQRIGKADIAVSAKNEGTIVSSLTVLSGSTDSPTSCTVR